MSNSDKWIDRIAKAVLKLDDGDAALITRFVLDGKRGEQIKLRIYTQFDKEEVLDILPTAVGAYVIAVNGEEIA